MKDQPDLDLYNTPGMVWQTWVPVASLMRLPRDADDLIDFASARLGYLTGPGWRRAYAWECAEAMAWGGTRPVPAPIWPPELHPGRPEQSGWHRP